MGELDQYLTRGGDGANSTTASNTITPTICDDRSVAKRVLKALIRNVDLLYTSL